MPDSRPLDETDISFVEYAMILARHKWFVFFIIVSAALGSVAWGMRQSLFYTASTSLSIGRIDGRLAESYTRIRGKLQGDVYGTIIRSDLGIEETRFPQIKSEGPENTNLLLLSVKSTTREEGVMILRKMNEIILADHEGFIKNEKEMIEQNIQRIYAKIGILEQEKKNISGKIQLLQDTAPSQQNLEGQLVLFDIRGELEARRREVNELYSTIDNTRRTLRDIEPTRILKEPAVSEYVIRPNLPFNAIAGGLGGALFAIVFVFMREWWQRSMRVAGGRERA